MKILTMKFWLRIFVLIIVFLNLFLIIVVKKNKTRTNDKYVITEYSMDINDKRNQEYFRNTLLLNFQYSTFEIKCSLVFVNNDSISKHKITDLIDDQVLIYRLSGNYCDECNNFVIKKLKQHFDDFESNKRILLVGSDINPRIIETNYYGKKIFSFAEGNFGLNLEDQEAPFLFLLSKDRKVELLFMPDKALSSYTDNYLELVRTIMFSESENKGVELKSF